MQKMYEWLVFKVYIWATTTSTTTKTAVQLTDESYSWEYFHCSASWSTLLQNIVQYSSIFQLIPHLKVNETLK